MEPEESPVSSSYRRFLVVALTVAGVTVGAAVGVLVRVVVPGPVAPYLLGVAVITHVVGFVVWALIEVRLDPSGRLAKRYVCGADRGDTSGGGLRQAISGNGTRSPQRSQRAAVPGATIRAACVSVRSAAETVARASTSARSRASTARYAP